MLLVKMSKHASMSQFKSKRTKFALLEAVFCRVWQFFYIMRALEAVFMGVWHLNTVCNDKHNPGLIGSILKIYLLGMQNVCS
mgnify:CR=1 FL=1